MNAPFQRESRSSVAALFPELGEAQRILVVDADESSCAQLVTAFREQGWDALGAHSGLAMDRLLDAGEVALIVLNQALPGEDGLSICRRLSRSEPQVGILFLSACADETDRIVALEIGADDYVVKPCSSRELVARARAFLRRRTLGPIGRRLRAPAEQPAPGHEGPWLLNPVCNSIISPGGVEIHLAAAEMALLNVMVGAPRTLLSRQDLLLATRGQAEVNYPRIVDITISRLRRKIGRVEPDHELVRTVRGRGYVLTAEVLVDSEAAHQAPARRRAVGR